MVAAGICWMGEGGQVEIAKLWEPQRCAEDEGREGRRGECGRRARWCWNALIHEVIRVSTAIRLRIRNIIRKMRHISSVDGWIGLSSNQNHFS